MGNLHPYMAQRLAASRTIDLERTAAIDRFARAQWPSRFRTRVRRRQPAPRLSIRIAGASG